MIDRLLNKQSGVKSRKVLLWITVLVTALISVWSIVDFALLSLDVKSDSSFVMASRITFANFVALYDCIAVFTLIWAIYEVIIVIKAQRIGKFEKIKNIFKKIITVFLTGLLCIIISSVTIFLIVLSIGQICNSAGGNACYEMAQDVLMTLMLCLGFSIGILPIFGMVIIILLVIRTIFSKIQSKKSKLG